MGIIKVHRNLHTFTVSGIFVTAIRTVIRSIAWKLWSNAHIRLPILCRRPHIVAVGTLKFTSFAGCCKDENECHDDRKHDTEFNICIFILIQTMTNCFLSLHKFLCILSKPNLCSNVFYCVLLCSNANVLQFVEKRLCQKGICVTIQ